ncbi:MAG: diguanylate cyclase [Halofilum sp. (in: g-proteobacteria)]|nr:diguanylate cyclase [Halofilum sp. (in: g-proteobacteria)]
MPIRVAHGGWSLNLVIALVVALAAGTWIYYRERAEVLANAAATFSVRADLIREYVGLMRHKVYALEDDIESLHATAGPHTTQTPLLPAIHEIPAYNVWGIDSPHARHVGLPLSGSLTGSARLDDPSGTLRTEIATILDVDSQFGTLLRHVTEIASVRYTSSNEFIYIAPAPDTASFHFSPSVYEIPAWVRTVPWNNPNRRQVITELHESVHGNGRVISIASPVALLGRFTGVVSIDLGIGRLRDFIGMGEAIGESILVDEHNRIVARRGDFDLDETYDAVASGDWRLLDDDAYWLRETVVARELRILHRLPESALALAAAQRSGLAWTILAATVSMVFISIRLGEALGQVRSLMNRDTLTYLLNRRGFELESRKLRDSIDQDRNMRTSLQLGNDRTALLLFDVDHFKQINDTHGHELGDDVLFSLARRLSAGVNEDDLVCRWGGEEILLLLVADRPEYFHAIAERLREAVESRPHTSEHVRVTVSGGLAEWRHDEHLEQALRRADRLLYAAKQAGRNRVETDIEA